MNKKTKKRIVGLALVFALFAVIGSGTLAYFTDQDDAENTFTMGNVKIELIEKERQLDEAGFATINGELVDFTQEKVLFPIVGSAQGDKDSTGQPIAAGYVDKIATVKNTGKSDAYIRFYFAIPSVLDDGYETFNAGNNVLHFNFGNDNGATTYGNTWQWKDGAKWHYYETTIDGVGYNVYFADYTEILEAGEETTQAISGLYLDNSFDMITKTEKDADGNVTETDVYTVYDKNLKKTVELTGMDDFINEDGEMIVNCPVFAVAVQTVGFDNAADAVDAAFGAQFNPWGGSVTNWQ